MRKTVKRTFAIVLIYSFLMLMLTGCHGQGSLAEFSVPEALDESRTIEITFWAKNDSNKPQADIYKKAIEDFETLYPNIKVNIRQYTDYGKIYNDVITNIATNTTPNARASSKAKTRDNPHASNGITVNWARQPIITSFGRLNTTRKSDRFSVSPIPNITTPNR